MDNKEQSGDSKDSAAPVSQSPSAAPQVDPLTNPNAASPQSEESAAIEGAEHSIEDLTSALVWWTRVLAFAAFVAIGVSIAQCREMRSQLQEMRIAESGADAQLSAANRLATAAENEYSAAKSGAWAAGSEAQTAADSEHRELRPYIDIVPNLWLQGIDKLLWIGTPGLQPMTGKITVSNGGRIPAINTTMVAGLKFGPAGGKFAPQNSDVHSIPVPKSFPLSNQITITITEIRKNTSSEVSHFQAGKLDAYMFGTIHYKDQFNTSHYTNFCYRYDRSGGDPIPCIGYTDAD